MRYQFQNYKPPGSSPNLKMMWSLMACTLLCSVLKEHYELATISGFIFWVGWMLCVLRTLKEFLG